MYVDTIIRELLEWKTKMRVLYCSDESIDCQRLGRVGYACLYFPSKMGNCKSFVTIPFY